MSTIINFMDKVMKGEVPAAYGEDPPCFDIWRDNNIGVELCYFAMSLLFIGQACYACLKRASIAI